MCAPGIIPGGIMPGGIMPGGMCPIISPGLGIITPFGGSGCMGAEGPASGGIGIWISWAWGGGATCGSTGAPMCSLFGASISD